MKLLRSTLAGLSASFIVMIFVFWGLAIWSDDMRWGMTAFLFFIAAVIFGLGAYCAAVAD